MTSLLKALTALWPFGGRRVPTLEIHLEDSTGSGAGRNYVKLCGQELAVTGVDFSLRAGEIASAVLYMIPRRADIIVLPEDVKIKIKNWNQQQATSAAEVEEE